MLMLVSPSKKLNFNDKPRFQGSESPLFLGKSQQLIDTMKKYSPQKLSKLMGISDQLAQLNVARFKQWHLPFNKNNAKSAIFAFSGDVYTGIDADSLDKRTINYLQKHLQILSGLYGLIRPLDLIQPYRLEMGKSVAVNGSKNLYQFWSETLTENINDLLIEMKKPILVNLASKEYFTVLDQQNINGRIITPHFRDLSNGRYRVLSFFAKKARGSMVRYAAINRVKNHNHLKEFDVDGYQYNPSLSTENDWVFTRDKR